MSHWAIRGDKPSPAKIIADYRAGHIPDETLWRLLSSYGSPFTPQEAAAIYEQLGFEPFNGFPLVRKDQ